MSGNLLNITFMFVTIERFRVRINGNLYHMTKFSINLCFAVHFFYPKTNSFTLVLSRTMVLKCF